MSSLTLTLAELAGIVLGAVALASTDPATLSRLGMAWLAKKLGVTPGEIVATDRATDGNPDTDPEAENAG